MLRGTLIPSRRSLEHLELFFCLCLGGRTNSAPAHTRRILCVCAYMLRRAVLILAIAPAASRPADSKACTSTLHGDFNYEACGAFCKAAKVCSAIITVRAMQARTLPPAHARRRKTTVASASAKPAASARSGLPDTALLAPPLNHAIAPELMQPQRASHGWASRPPSRPPCGNRREQPRAVHVRCRSPPSSCCCWVCVSLASWCGGVRERSSPRRLRTRCLATSISRTSPTGAGTLTRLFSLPRGWRRRQGWGQRGRREESTPEAGAPCRRARGTGSFLAHRVALFGTPPELELTPCCARHRGANAGWRGPRSGFCYIGGSV